MGRWERMLHWMWGEKHGAPLTTWLFSAELQPHVPATSEPLIHINKQS